MKKINKYFLVFIIITIAFAFKTDQAKADAWWGEGYRSPEWVKAHGGTIVNFTIEGGGKQDKYKTRMYKADDMVEIEYGKSGHFDDAIGGGAYKIIAFKGTNKYADITITACPGADIYLTIHEDDGDISTSGCVGGKPAKPKFKFSPINLDSLNALKKVNILKSWINGKTSKQGLYYLLTAKESLKNSKDEGIWFSDYKTLENYQLLSFNGFLKTIDKDNESLKLENVKPSPNKKLIALKVNNKENLASIWIYNIENSNYKKIADQIVTSPENETLIWSPDSQKIAYEKGLDSNKRIIVIDILSEESSVIDKTNISEPVFLDNTTLLFKNDSSTLIIYNHKYQDIKQIKLNFDLKQANFYKFNEENILAVTPGSTAETSQNSVINAFLINTNTESAEPFKLGGSIGFENSIKKEETEIQQYQTIKLCQSNNLVLEQITPALSPSSYLIYNLKTNTSEKINFKENILKIFCKEKNIIFLKSESLTIYDYQNNNTTKKSINELLKLNNKGCFPEFSENSDFISQKNFVFKLQNSTQNACKLEEGLYFKSKSITKNIKIEYNSSNYDLRILK